ncbi:aldo/keto reductase [Nonomuraea terrae]|uniref:aldo/keto reductase n=1 Tax=Nonomuraea terrae TaxID=2530383 RepID=UPI001CB6C137|nr:aldo/keto reductase [Nonomuraea terrae]
MSAVSLGTMTFGGNTHPLWSAIGGLGLDQARVLVDRSLDAGVNLFDAADAYGDGESEEILGALLGSRRQDVLIATKLAMRVGNGPNALGLSRLHVMRSIEGSLRRLGTDYIDLYQMHNFDPLTPIEETLGALDDAVRQGKIRYVGASNLTGWQAMKALGAADRGGLPRLVSMQSYYSLSTRDIEAEILPMARDQKLGHLVYSPLAGGLLSGKFDRTGNTDESARRARFQSPPVDLEQAYDIIDCLRQVAERHRTSTASAALAWVLAQEGVTSVILGARRPDQLDDNLSALDVRLTEEDLRELETVSAPRVPSYPGYVQEQFRINRLSAQA